MLRGSEPDLELLGYLAATRSGDPPRWGGVERWYPVWAARGLRYAWDPTAASAVVAALSADHWRVREMAANVCLERELGEAADSLAGLTGDPVPRVRSAAARALGAVGEAEHAEFLHRLLTDHDPTCREKARRALERLSLRLDRDLT